VACKAWIPKSKVRKGEGARVDAKAIVLTGTPGTGKTSVSARLAEALSLDTVHVNDLVLRERLYSGYDGLRDTYVIDIRRASRRISEVVTTSSKEVLIEGHLAQLVASRRLVETALVLRCHPIVLKERLRRQGYRAEKVRENVLAELLDVCLVETVRAYGPRKVAEIDTTRRAIDDVSKEALEALSGVKRQLYVFDWIAELDAEGALGEFLV